LKTDLFHNDCVIDTAMAYLVMHRGPEPGKIFRLTGDTIRIGRGSRNNIIIHDNEVSREHAQLQQTPEGFLLQDLKSSNGTFVNGQEVVDSWLLTSQCIIELGDTITFEYHPGEPDDEEEKTADLLTQNRNPAYLVVNTQSQDEPAVYPLDNIVTKVGRSTACDIVVLEPEISREHFKLTLNQLGYIIEDLGSTNGVSVNEEILTEPRLITPNDVIQIGKTITFQITETPEMFSNLIRTNLLLDTKELTDPDNTSVRRRKRTQQMEIPTLISSPDPSHIGTGLEGTDLHNQVLITYDRNDWERIVAPLVDTLYDAKIGAWVDQYLIEGSSDWLVATEQARRECWLLVVVVSPGAMRSEQVKRNWRHFHNREKPILLLIHQPVERMPIGARRLYRVQYNPAVPEASFNQLIKEIKRLKMS